MGHPVVFDLELHPAIHNVSKTHEIRVMIAQQEFDLIYKLIHEPELPYKDISSIVREAIHEYASAVLVANESSLLPDDLNNWLRQVRATSRWMVLQQQREAQQKFLRLARDELCRLVEGQKTDRLEKAYFQIEGTMKDLYGAQEELWTSFLSLPVVKWVRQWKEGLAADQDTEYEFDMEAFHSEVGIP